MDLRKHVEAHPECVAPLKHFQSISDQQIEDKLALFTDEPFSETSPLIPVTDFADQSGGLPPVTKFLDWIRPKQFRNEPYETFKGHVIAKDHSYDKPETCKFEYIYYRSLSPNATGSVMFLIPPIQGLTFIEKNVAMHTVRNGTHCMIALPTENPTDISRPIAHLESMQRRMIKGVRHLITHVSTFPEVNPNRIIVTGASLGGNNAALALSVDLRIKAAMTFVAGGNFPELLSESTQPLAKRYRQTRMRIEGVSSVEDYRRRIADSIRVDTLFFARRRSPKDIYMIMGKNDVDVPFRNQIQLWQGFGQPKHSIVNRGHVLSILRYPFFYVQGYEFLFQRLNELEGNPIPRK